MHKLETVWKNRLPVMVVFLSLLLPNWAAAQDAGTGRIAGQLIDDATGENLTSVTIIAQSTSNGEEYVGISDKDGRFIVRDVPVGEYDVRLFKAGYQLVEITGIEVEAPGEAAQIKYAMQARVQQTAPVETRATDDDVGDSDVFDLAAFTVTAEQMSDQEATFFDLRRNVSGTVDFLTSEDFSKFAVSDLAGAVQKMPGVNVVEGKFAVVRGLSDRFNSTTVNGLPVPSPDPLRQGVQLDLFPTSIIDNVVAVKSFLPHLPGNSSGAAFQLQTRTFPEEFESSLKIGFRINVNALDTYLEDPESNSKDMYANGKGERGPFASENPPDIGGVNLHQPFLAEETDPPITLTLGSSIGDTVELFGRKLGYVFSFSYNASAVTEKNGVFRDWYGISSRLSPPGFPGYNENRFIPGSLFTGEMEGSGQMEYTRSIFSVLMGGLASFSYDLDKAGLHRIRAVLLVSQAAEDSVRRLSEGFLPENGVTIDPFGSNGAVIGVPNGNESGYFYSDQVEYEERSLTVWQLLGEHLIEDFNELEVDWGIAYSRTTSDLPRQIDSNYLRFSDEIDEFETPGFGVEGGNDGVGAFLQEIELSIDQDQYSGRIDFSLPFQLLGAAGAEIKTGAFYDSAEREVTGRSQVLDATGESTSIRADSPSELSRELVNLDSVASNVNSFPTTADVTQDILSGYLQFVVPLPRNLTLEIGARYSQLEIEAAGSSTLAGGSIGPGGASLEQILAGFRIGPDGVPVTNGEILGFENPEDPSGSVDEELWLPGLALTWEPSEKLKFIFGFSETVARPSFRELSPYFDRDVQTGDIVLGNPNLDIVDVRSYEIRGEYLMENGGVASVSLFKKEIDNPIEGVLLRSQPNISFRSFFNNPTTADLEGIELEFSRSLDFLSESLSKFSFGINYSRIEATVAVPDFLPLSYFQFTVNPNTGNINRVVGPFVGDGGPPYGIPFEDLPLERRLFDQPEWITNLDITYDDEDIGLRVTLSLYAQSSVLSGVGVGSPADSQNVLDQYTGSYHELNLSISKTLPFLGEGAVLNFAVTNITDSDRKIFYDEDVAFADSYERLTYNIGQTYRLSLEFTF